MTAVSPEPDGFPFSLWKALQMHTGAIIKPDEQLVNTQSGGRRLLYLFWDTVSFHRSDREAMGFTQSTAMRHKRGR